MKAIKKILLIAITLYSTGINAQETQKRPDGKLITDTTVAPPTLPDYYTGKDIISGTGFSFKNIEEDNKYIKIGNVNNSKFGTSPFIEDTGLFYEGDEEQFPPDNLDLLARFNDMNQLLGSVRDALGTSIINQFKSTNNSANIDIIFIVSMNGTVAEIEFSLKKDSLLLSIPPEKFHTMESLIKQRVTFSVEQKNNLKFIPRVIVSGKIKDL
ncbi:MAG: hypothetical protein LBP85_08305 [Prevotellaceae bacterium]|jgi:hypothetical protein|nr:hypothetical protein [Prevotellaceae bacterium]